MIQCVVPCTVHEIATCHFQCTLITAAAWAVDRGWLFVFKSHSVDVALLRGACHCFRVNYRWAVIAARCSVSHEPETQRHTPHAFVIGGLHFTTLGHLQRQKCQTSLLAWTWWNERVWRSITIRSFVFLYCRSFAPPPAESSGFWSHFPDWHVKPDGLWNSRFLTRQR